MPKVSPLLRSVPLYHLPRTSGLAESTLSVIARLNGVAGDSGVGSIHTGSSIADNASRVYQIKDGGGTALVTYSYNGVDEKSAV